MNLLEKTQAILDAQFIDFSNLSPMDRFKIEQRLRAPFAPGDLELRPNQMDYTTKKAVPLVYIDSRTVAKRLDQIFGSGCWSVTDNNFSTGNEYKWEETTVEIKKDDNGKPIKGSDVKEFRENRGLFVGCSCSISINKGQYQTTVSNVGDKNMKNPLDNKLTGSQAQAFKRAASLLGIGAYLYGMKMSELPVKWREGSYKFEEYSDSEIIQILDKDNVIGNALKSSNFHSICEISGESVDWKIAAFTMDKLGMILSQAEAKKFM